MITLAKLNRTQESLQTDVIERNPQYSAMQLHTDLPSRKMPSPSPEELKYLK